MNVITFKKLEGFSATARVRLCMSISNNLVFVVRKVHTFEYGVLGEILKYIGTT